MSRTLSASTPGTSSACAAPPERSTRPTAAPEHSRSICGPSRAVQAVLRVLSQRLHAAPRTRANRDGRSLSPNAHDRWAGARVALVARTVSVLPTRGCASRRASAAENGAWAIVASGQGTKQRRAVGSDRNHPVPEPCCSRVGALVSKGAALVGVGAIGPFGTFAAAMPSLIPQSCGMRCGPHGQSGESII